MFRLVTAAGCLIAYVSVIVGFIAFAKLYPGERSMIYSGVDKNGRATFSVGRIER